MRPCHAVRRRLHHHHLSSPNSSLAYTVQVEAVTKTNTLINGNRTDGTAVTAPQMEVYWQAIGH
jgi:hypothetical protein